MRSSYLFVLALLVIVVIPVALLGAHSPSSGGGGGSVSSASSSHASSGGGYSGSGSASSRISSTTSSNPSSHGTSASHSNSVRDVRGANGTDGVAKGHEVVSTKATAQPEKKSFLSFLRHPQKKRDPLVADLKQPPCRKQPCPVPCPGGGLRGKNGACAVVANSCPLGQSWNGFSCRAYWSNSCDALARQLEAQRRQMLGGSDPGQSLIYRTLRDQYEQCVRRYGYAFFGSYAYNGLSLFDTP